LYQGVLCSIVFGQGEVFVAKQVAIAFGVFPVKGEILRVEPGVDQGFFSDGGFIIKIDCVLPFSDDQNFIVRELHPGQVIDVVKCFSAGIDV
jgi:hypothetical protein